MHAPLHGYRVIALLLLTVAAGAARAGAQSLTAGSLAGTVRESGGAVIPDAAVTLMDRASGERRTLRTRFDGAFSFPLLLPAEYDALVERFGFRPRLVQRIPVRAGSTVLLDVGLGRVADGEGIDTSAYGGAPPGGMHLALTRGSADEDLASLGDPLGLLTSPAPLLPGADGTLGADGLPGRLGATALDGVTRWSARHPRIPGAALDGLAHPLASVRGLELLAGGMDAEWPGSGGGVLSGFTIPGERRTGGTVFASGGAEGATASVVLSGSIVPDTARFSLGVSGLRLAPEYGAPWTDSSSGVIASIAADSGFADLGSYRRPYKGTTTIVSGFGRFDGTLSRAHRVAVRAAAATATIENPDLGPDAAPALGARLRARDISAAAELSSVISPQVGSELRLAVDVGDRRYESTPLAGTRYTDGGFSAGTPEFVPGTFKRSTVRVSQTVHVRLNGVGLKGGVAVSFATHDQTYSDGREGSYYFGDSTGFAGRSGAFRQTVGTIPVAHFTIPGVGLFAQAALNPVPGLEVLGAIRFDTEGWPSDQIRLNSEWLRVTGIDNRPSGGRRSMVSPRLAFTWGLGPGRGWQVRGETGLFAEPLDPGVFAEAFAYATGASVRRGFGALGAWPAVPDSVAAPVQGQTLAILGPAFEPPRTGRIGFGITGNVGGTLLRIETDYRHTDFLPVRRDLNLALSPGARDQFGRPLYGALAKSGTLLAALPGGNRRFAGFDEVMSLDAAGASDYLAVTLGLERAVARGLALLASYTFSRTTDNWFGARAGGREAQLVPFADSTGRSSWADDRSDFDVPHRLVLGAELRLEGRLDLRVAALYRLRSGYPFTPGFRDGVDANADGSGRNDPAFVSDTVQGAADVVQRSDCLRPQVGAFAGRNSCRDPMAGALDLRLALTLARPGGRPAELILDGFGLVRSGSDIYDHALYLVDAAAPLSTDATTGVTTVPLVANPNFGRALVRRDAGPILRAGVRVSF